jgi:hypothetical protein
VVFSQGKKNPQQQFLGGRLLKSSWRRYGCWTPGVYVHNRFREVCCFLDTCIRERFFFGLAVVVVVVG